MLSTLPRCDADAVLPTRAELGANRAFITACVSRLDEVRGFSDPQTAAGMEDLQSRLFQAGRHDVALGRLFEGHVDAWQILHRYGDAVTIETIKQAETKPVLGVWNAEGPDHRLHCDGSRISGGKSYASGAGILTHALVTSAAGTADVQLHLVDLAQSPPEIDRSWWRVAGMQASETHRVTWSGANAIPIGSPGDYEREPWFSGGALRFATVQAGGLAGLCDAVRTHLVTLGRSADPVQKGRLADLYAEASSAANTVVMAGRASLEADRQTLVSIVGNARNIVYACAERGIAIAQRACGTAAYFEENAVCRFAQDLGMYIRQPGPDAQRARVGAAVAAGDLDIWPCNR